MVGSRKYSLSRVERVEGRKPSPSRISSKGEVVVGVSRSEREMAEVKVGARAVFEGVVEGEVGARGGFSRERGGGGNPPVSRVEREVVVVGVSRFE